MEKKGNVHKTWKMSNALRLPKLRAEERSNYFATIINFKSYYDFFLILVKIVTMSLFVLGVLFTWFHKYI